MIKPRRRYRRAHPGYPKSIPQGPNDIWAADEFRLKNGKYCFPLTVSDLSSRFLLGVDAHPNISLEKTVQHVRVLFDTYGLPNRIRTDNGTPFASNALARLSQLSVWFIKLGIYPELWNIPRFWRGSSLENRSRTASMRGCIVRSNKRLRSHRQAACEGNSANSIGFGRNSIRSVRTKQSV